MNAAAQNSSNQPVLTTARLVLRPFTPEDALLLAQLAGKFRVADTTASIPHPYSADQALQDVHKFNDEFGRGVGAYFAIVLREAPHELIGCVLLKLIDRRDEQAELGYWIDEAASGKGYVTEACRVLLHYGFNELHLNRISACHMTRNPASGRVLARLGMQQEGHFRQAAKKWGKFEDLLVWAILREEFK
ncbi:MAG TPA: GNAT family N-acetyltransferase [Candidatus Angelobacter sp.]